MAEETEQDNHVDLAISKLMHSASPNEADTIALTLKETAADYCAKKIVSYIESKAYLGDDRYPTVLRALGIIGSHVAVEFLTEILTKSNDEWRPVAAWSLGEIGDFSATKPLTEALTYTSLMEYNGTEFYSDNNLKCAGVRYAAVLALGKLRDRCAVGPLIAVLDQTNGATPSRDEVINALGEIGDPGATHILLELLASDTEHRNEIVRALGKIRAARAVRPLLSMLRRSDKSDPYLLEANIVEALGRIGDVRALKPLVRRLQNAKTAVCVAQALERLGDARAIEPLIRYISSVTDPDAGDAIRSLAARNIRKLSKRVLLLMLNLQDLSYVTEGYIDDFARWKKGNHISFSSTRELAANQLAERAHRWYQFWK